MAEPLEQLYGRLIGMQQQPVGSTLTADAAIGATVLSVAETGDFDEDGGELVTPDGTVYTYSAVDDDALTVTLDTALTAALSEDDQITLYDSELGGEIVEYVGMVLLDDQDPGDEPIEVTVQHSLVDLLTETIRGGAAEAVTLVRDGEDDFMIWQVDGKVAVNVALEEAVTGVQANIDDALNDAADALNLAQASNAVFRQATAPSPTSVTLRANDTWFDTDDGNRPYRWSGSAWVESTSAWLKTNPAGTFPNTIISPAGLVAYNSSGVAVTTIDSSDGSITTTGGLWVGGDVSGATVTGGTTQTEATPNRGVKMNSSGLVAYNSSGTPTFVVTASTGAVTMKGTLTSGSTVEGSTFSTGGAFPILISGSAIQWSAGVFLNYSGADLNIANGSSAIQIGSGVDIFGSLTLHNSIIGNATATGEVHGSELYADSLPTSSGGTDVQMGASGRLFKISSSRRYKTAIKDADTDGIIARLRKVRVRQWRYKKKYADPANPERLHIGGIAEELDDLGLGDFVARDAEGRPDAINEKALVWPLLAWVRRLEGQIDDLAGENAALTARLEALEARA